MERLMLMLRFILKRAWHQQAILLPVLLGVLAVATVLSSVPLFSTTAANASLRGTLNDSTAILDHNVEVQFTTPALAPNTYAQAASAVTANVQEYLGRTIAPNAPIRTGEVSKLLIYDSDNHRFPKHIPYLSSALGNLWFHSNMSKAHLTLTAGRFPSSAVTITQTGLGAAYEVESMLMQEWADQLKLKLGDTLDLLEPAGARTRFLRLRFVGFFHPTSLKDPAWFGDLDPLTPPIHYDDDPNGLPPPPFWVSESAFEQAVPQVGLKQSIVYTWFYYLHLNGLSAANAQTLRGNLQQLKQYFAQSAPGNPQQPISYSVLSTLDQVLANFFQQEFFVTLSTLIAILPGLALLLLYVILASAALTERNRDEIALMKSRGASGWQVLSLSLLDALLLCGVALLAAPPLASGITSLITRLSFFGATAAASGSTLAAPDFQTYLYALVAVLCCLAALLTPAALAARASIIPPRQRAARPGKAWLWLRLAPGSLLAALGGFGYVEIAQRGAFFTRSAKGALSVDWVASSAPTLLLLGMAGLSLLLLPLLLIALDRLVQRLPGIAASLALRQMARRPAPYSRLALLLTLTVTLGIFASLFSGTLLSSIEERAAYQSGADLRLMEGALDTADVNRQAAPLADHLAFLPGATDGMNIFRDTQAHLSNALQAASLTTLAIDSSKFARLVYWRSDFANQPLSSLLTTLQQSIQQPDSLPVLVDDRLLADSGTHLGDSINIQLGNAPGISSNQSVPVAVNFVIVGTFHYFPTLDTTQYAVVCDLSKLLQLVNGLRLVTIAPNEVWLKLAPNAPQYTVDSVIQQLTFNRSHRQVVVALNQVYDRAALEQTYRNDPLHFSISGALSLDFVVAALLSVIGFVLLFYLLARRRAFEFGVLRAMGLSLRQLAGSLGWEQGILVCAAAILGGALGILLAQAVLPALATDNSGKPLLPPYAPQLDVGSVIQLGLFLLACALAALVATLVIFRRLRLQEVLRLGEE